MTPGAIVFRGPTDRPRIALTFDDGPCDCTSDLLEVLNGHEVKATFFMDGRQVNEHPDIARRVRDGGHEIGVHSMAHRDHDQDVEKALTDVREGADVIEKILGIELKLFRAPYGHFVLTTLHESDRRGWVPVYWSAWGMDWTPGEATETIAARVIADLMPGAIVLLHDCRRDIPVECGPKLGALELVLAEARNRGLEPVTVSELLA